MIIYWNSSIIKKHRVYLFQQLYKHAKCNTKGLNRKYFYLMMVAYKHVNAQSKKYIAQYLFVTLKKGKKIGLTFSDKVELSGMLQNKFDENLFYCYVNEYGPQSISLITYYLKKIKISGMTFRHGTLEDIARGISYYVYTPAKKHQILKKILMSLQNNIQDGKQYMNTYRLLTWIAWMEGSRGGVYRQVMQCYVDWVFTKDKVLRQKKMKKYSKDIRIFVVNHLVPCKFHKDIKDLMRDVVTEGVKKCKKEFFGE